MPWPFPVRAYPALRCAVLWLLGVSLLVTTACGNPTPDPCPSHEEAEYLGKVTEIMESVDGQIKEIGRLFGLVVVNEMAMYDDQWISLLAIALIILELNTEEIRGIASVPASMLHIHSDLEGMADNLDRYIDAVPLAVSTWDADDFFTMGALLTQAQISGASVVDKSLAFVEACTADTTQ